MRNITKNVLILVLVVAICLVVLSGCGSIKKETDWFSLRGNEVKREGISLQDADYETSIYPDVESIQVTQDYLFTNTKQIVVSVDDITKNVEIELFLYASASNSDPIGYATLSDEERTAVFSNLSSSVDYKVGAAISNSSELVKLIITD